MDPHVPTVLATGIATWAIPIVAGSSIGVLVGFLAMRWLGRSRLETARIEAERLLKEAHTEAEVALKTA